MKHNEEEVSAYHLPFFVRKESFTASLERKFRCIQVIMKKHVKITCSPEINAYNIFKSCVTVELRSFAR